MGRICSNRSRLWFFILGEPAVALIGGEYLQHIFGLSDYGVHLLAFLIITAMTLITFAGVRLVSFSTTQR